MSRISLKVGKFRIRGTAHSVEALELRAYLTGIVLGNPVDTATGPLGLSPVFANLAPFVTNSPMQADLFVANAANGQGSVSVLLSNGNGSFNPNVDTIAVPGTPLPLATGDFDTGVGSPADGKLDIVAGTTNTGSPGDISVILGNGDGTFKTPDNIPALGNNNAIAVGAFIDGGNLDVVTVSNSFSNVNNAGIVFVHSKSFVPFSLPFGSVSAVVAGDINGDGHDDFAVLNQGNGSVSVFLGNGDGSFKAPVTYPTGPSPASLTLGQFRSNHRINGLPELDIVTADATTGEVNFLANNGDGTFAAPVNSTVAGSAIGGGVVNVRFTDLNGDGIPDLLCLLSPGGSGDATAMLGNGDGTFRTGTIIATNSGTPTGVAAGDLAGTGFTDVVLTSNTEITAFSNITSLAPSAAVDASQSPPVSQATTYAFTVTYTDANQINANTIGDANLVVTFPGGSQQAATLVPGQTLISQAAVTANYQVTFPSGLNAADNGTYTVALNDGSVKNASGIAAAADNIGTFNLSLPGGVVTPPSGDFAVSAVTGKFPTDPVVGSRQRTGPSVTVTYNGTATVSNAILTVTLYTSNTTIHDSSSVAAAVPVTVKVGKLKPGRTFKIHFKPFLYPATAGSYYLVSDVALNCALDSFDGATASPIAVAAAFVDASALVARPTRHTLVTGKKASAILTFENLGNVAYSGPATVDVLVLPAAGGIATAIATALPVKLHLKATGVGPGFPVKIPRINENLHFVPAALPTPGSYNVELRINLPGDIDSANDVAVSLMTVTI